MKSIAKTLCKLKKDQLTAILPQLAAELPEAAFLCRRCGRAAKCKKWLCKPAAVEKLAKQYRGQATVATDRH